MEEESEQDALWRMTSDLDFRYPIENLPEAVSQLEKDNIVQALEKHTGNRTKAAEDLGIGRTNLIAKIKKYKIKLDDQGEDFVCSIRP